jgi:lantibiotic transport system ATP-binding protein
MKTYAIETFGLTRRFGRLTAVEALDLKVPRGSIYGFLGPNGAGKTTTIRMLLGLIRPQAGNILLFGGPLAAQRAAILRRTGSLVETPSLYPHLTGWETLELFRRMTGGRRPQVQRALALVHLEDAAHRLVREYSLGMRQRLGLAVAFLNEPELLILDEPTNGLDPAGIREIRELICDLPQREGVSIFVSSHMLSEVEQIATHIGIINQGRLIFQGTPEQLRASYQEQVQLTTDQLPESHRFLERAGWPVSDSGNHHLNVKVNGASDAALINQQLVQAGHQVYHLSLAQPSLEDIFLTLTTARIP